jgi:hypothetical protein
VKKLTQLPKESSLNMQIHGQGKFLTTLSLSHP